MANEIRFIPTLFLFLGTSVGQIGWRLKNLIRRAYGDIPVLKSLWVDADSTVDTLIAPWFTNGERVELVGFNSDAVLAHLGNFPTLQSWWPHDTHLKPGFISHGAGQMRPVGRLSLFRMFNDRNSGPAFIDRLNAAVEAIQQIDNIDATERLSTEKTRFIVERGSFRVVLIFSTCGGTGSALAYDLAYLCRHLLRHVNVSISAIALLPSIIDKAIKNEVPTQRERIRANTYAFFKELDYLIENPVWRVQYPEGAPVNVMGPPFDSTFVVDLGNQAGNRLNSEDDVFNMIATGIFLDTGSSIAGVIRGFNANVGVLVEEFQGRRRAYSSLAAASLVYPAQKILSYCSARFGLEMIHQVSLAQSDKRIVHETAQALLGQGRLHDDQFLEDLLAGQSVSGLNLPAIRKANDVESLRRLLALQEESDTKDREHIKTKISERAHARLEEAMQRLPAEVSRIALERGVRFAQAVVEELASSATGNEHLHESETSFAMLRAKVMQQGTGEQELSQAEDVYRQARERLRAMSGDIRYAVLKIFLRKTWQEALNRARTDCLTSMAEVNRMTLQLYAQRQAAVLYEQMGEHVRVWQRTLLTIRQSVERALEKLEERANEAVQPSSPDDGIYELNIEAVDGSYIRHFYKKHGSALNPVAAYRGFVEERQVSSLTLEQLTDWTESNWADRLQEHGRGYFAGSVNETSLLGALAEYYGDEAKTRIEAFLDRLARYCHPFWQYDANSGIQGQEGKSIIGLEDEHSDLIPQRYKDDPQYEIKSTGFKHRIDFARVQHGLPAFLLRDMADYKAYYDKRRKVAIDPLHIFPEAFLAEEVIPEEKQESRHVFATAAAMGYIIQIGSFYYFDPEREYTVHGIRPAREFRLDQGRDKAEDAFVLREDFVRQAEQMIEKDIVNMGNQAAIQLLGERIRDHKQALAKMPPDSDLRRQFEDEIRALQGKQVQLGQV